MSAVKLIREMALIRANVKDEKTREQLLAPMERQLQAMAAEAARQTELDLVPQVDAKPATPKK